MAKNYLKPKRLLNRWGAGEFYFELPLALATFGTGILTGIRFFGSDQLVLAVASVAIASIAALTLLFRAIWRRKKASGEAELHALTGTLHTLHGILTGNVGTSYPQSKLRICVFVPHENPETVNQITDYIGEGEPRGRDRDLSSRCGIVGLAFRSGEKQFDKLPKGSKVTDYLVSNYGFARGEAAGMRQDRRSWAAIPIGEPGHVVAVIYMDSTERDFFGNSNHIRRKVIESATIGVANFIRSTK